VKYKVGDRVRIKPTLNTDDTTPNCWVSAKMIIKRGQIYPIVKIAPYGLYGLDLDNNKEDCWWFTEEMLEPVDNIVRMADGTIIGDFSTGGFCDGFRCGKIPTPSKPVSIEEQFGLPKGVSIHDLDITSLYRSMNIDAQPLELVCNEEKAKEIAERLNKELTRHFNAFSKRTKGTKADNIYFDEWTFKEEKKMPTKFTFYKVEGYRMDKSNNTKIPTVTTEVVYKDKDGCATGGSATCDKADYDERQGVIEALANMCCDGNFDREYNKVIKWNKKQDLRNRTCRYCGQVFDTYQERIKHMDWHVERKKARRERYLLRKRAKEIAFEEQAQKLAKEMKEGQK
jgi:hypothetical protein